MFLWTFLKSIGHLFKRIFGNQYVAEYAAAWAETAAKIVALLMQADNLNGSTKLQTIISILKAKAAEQGEIFVAESARLLVELEVAHIHNDDINRIFADGLDLAEAAVQRALAVGLSGDELASEAGRMLIDDLKAAGKLELAEIKRTVNLLIAAAIAQIPE
ncbi:MAG: hypothetical protein WC455_14760 [Dehalococcoidia bacterium]|jgi:hypothetical protein